MSFTHLFMRSPLTGVHKVKFDADHFKYMGVPQSSLGMPKLEAYVLVNKWNRANSVARSAKDNYTYWLEDET